MGIVYELILLFGVLWIADYTFSALTRFRGDPGLLRTAFQLFTLAVLAVYFTGFWSHGRRSLPMKTLSLQLLTDNDRPLGELHAFARFALAFGLWMVGLAAGYYLSAWLYLLVLVPFAWALFDRDRRALYDVLAGTRLVKLAPDPALRSIDA